MGATKALKAVLFSAIDFITLYYIPVYLVNLFAAQGITLPKFDTTILFYLAISVAVLTLIGNLLGGLKGIGVDVIKLAPRIYYTIKMFDMISVIRVVIEESGEEIVMIITIDFGLVFWLTLAGIILGFTRGILNKYYEHIKKKEKEKIEGLLEV